MQSRSDDSPLDLSTSDRGSAWTQTSEKSNAAAAAAGAHHSPKSSSARKGVSFRFAQSSRSSSLEPVREQGPDATSSDSQQTGDTVELEYTDARSSASDEEAPSARTLAHDVPGADDACDNDGGDVQHVM
mmetsp:Transcript_5471/g.22686  ORF Transcript_5471/g.22686 Transcript_5471/m.22686 type:complete len:130 (+) Transcript_5471:674-1063(+)